MPMSIIDVIALIGSSIFLHCCLGPYKKKVEATQHIFPKVNRPADHEAPDSPKIFPKRPNTVPIDERDSTNPMINVIMNPINLVLESKSGQHDSPFEAVSTSFSCIIYLFYLIKCNEIFN